MRASRKVAYYGIFADYNFAYKLSTADETADIVTFSARKLNIAYAVIYRNLCVVIDRSVCHSDNTADKC